MAAIALWGADKDSPGSWLMLVNGAVTIALGALVLFNPSLGIWFIGVLAGIDLIFSGAALMARGGNS